jgi:hypothetical protein
MLHTHPEVLVIRTNVTHQEVEKYHIVMLAITDSQGGLLGYLEFPATLLSN